MHRLHRPEVAPPGAIVRTGAAALAGWLALSPGAARADHDMASHDHGGSGPRVQAGVAFEIARYKTAQYEGSHQGISPSLTWLDGRFGAGAAVGFYHLTKNGLGAYGIGDAMLTGHAAVVADEALQAGVALHAMLPTGSDDRGFGMGHAMAMPSLWGSWRAPGWAVRASAGYARALTALHGDHDHGLVPLVDPMNLQELTWSTGAELEVSRAVRVGGRAHGGLAIGGGRDRVIGAGRVTWTTELFTTAFELQHGLAGDPFSIRGVVETALRF